MLSSGKGVGYIKKKIVSPIREFFHDSRAVGITLMCCTVVSLVVSNTQWGADYIGFWNTELHMPAPNVHFPHTPLHLVNDLLMAVFFLLVGVEIKREIMVGELSSIKQSLLPIIAALGGMVAPALFYLVFTHDSEIFSRGWGIPMATDIAFSLGILSMLGKRIPFTLRVFLMALAIIDDLGGILTIAIFYAEEINSLYLFLGIGMMFVLILLNILKVKRYYIYMFLGIFMWYFMYNSGVHATIAGVMLAFVIPLHKIGDLVTTLHDPVNFIILPIFALANTAIMLPTSYDAIFSSVVYYGILAGLIMGKPIGIFLLSWVAVKLGAAALPKGVNWKQILGVGLLAGIGFTISLFISTLAFAIPEIQVTAKVAIIVASLIAGVLGYVYLFIVTRNTIPIPNDEEEDE